HVGARTPAHGGRPHPPHAHGIRPLPRPGDRPIRRADPTRARIRGLAMGPRPASRNRVPRRGARHRTRLTGPSAAPPTKNREETHTPRGQQPSERRSTPGEGARGTPPAGLKAREKAPGEGAWVPGRGGERGCGHGPPPRAPAQERNFRNKMTSRIRPARGKVSRWETG